MAGPLWSAASEDPNERARKADREWRRLKRLTQEQRRQERIRAAEHNREDVKTQADLNLRLAKDQLEIALRQGTRADTSYLEGSRLYFDVFRTRATLSIGAVAGAPAVASLLRPGLDYIPLIVASVVCLLAGMVVALESMRFVSANVFTVLGSPDPDQIEEFSENNSPKLERRDRASSWSLVAGIILFGVFAILNLAYPAGDFLDAARTLLSP